MRDKGTPAHNLAASRMFLTARDVDDLIRIAGGLPPNANVVDLGAGSGTTAIAMFQTREDIRVWTFDINAENVDWARINIAASLGNDPLKRWVGIVCDAGLAAETFQPPVHALLHDASHEEGDVYRDLMAWESKLAPNAMIWVHDYGEMAGAAETYPGVKKAVDRFLARHTGPSQRKLQRQSADGIGWMCRVLE